MKSFIVSASIVCGNMLNIGEEIRALERAGVEHIHFDVMDGVFVPRYGLLPELLAPITRMTTMPVEVHMMVTDPEPYITDFAKAGAKIFYVHVENNNHLHRTLKKIRDSGMKAGVVLNMATPLTTLDYILEDIDYIMLMGINPGIVGHKIIPQIYDKIADVKQKIKGTPIKILIDGGVSPESSAKMIAKGADILVCGTSTIFRPSEGTLEQVTAKYRQQVEKDLISIRGQPTLGEKPMIHESKDQKGNPCKVVMKPWGKEEWLELNNRYCYKRIYINQGHKTSFQYHKQKIETNYIISGTAEVWLENEKGEIEKKTMGPGSFFNVRPPKKHRVIAITDIVLQEVSTPEVDDVIRINDEFGRKDGRIDSEHISR